MSNFTIGNQGKKVDMVIVPQITQSKKNGRRNSPAIPAGTVIYCLKYVHPNGGYFTYSYLRKENAESVIENCKINRTNTEYYMEWNRVGDPQKTLHVGKIEE